MAVKKTTEVVVTGEIFRMRRPPTEEGGIVLEVENDGHYYRAACFSPRWLRDLIQVAEAMQAECANHHNETVELDWKGNPK